MNVFYKGTVLNKENTQRPLKTHKKIKNVTTRWHLHGTPPTMEARLCDIPLSWTLTTNSITFCSRLQFMNDQWIGKKTQRPLIIGNVSHNSLNSRRNAHLKLTHVITYTKT